MNILKLNLNKNTPKVKRGQIVSPLHYEDGIEQLVDRDGKIVPTALYVVKSVSLSGGKHSLVLRPISYDLAQERWAPGAPDYTTDMDDDGLERHLGICKNARKGGIFTEYLRDLFRKYGKGKSFDDTIDYDGVLKGSVYSIFEKSPIHIDPDDRDAIMIDAIMQSANKETVQRFNPNDPHPFLMMVLALFKKKVLTGVHNFNRIHMREVHNKNDEMTDDEFYDTMGERDLHDVNPHSKNPHRELVEKELVYGIRKYLEGTKESNIMVNMFDMFQKGYQNKEVIDELNKKYNLTLKPVNFTKTYMPKFKDYIWEYAFKTKNKLLMDLMNVQMDKPRLSSEQQFQAGTNNFLQEVFKEYKKVTGEMEADSSMEQEHRDPVGKITKIQRTTIGDIMDEDYVAGMVLSDKVSAEDFQDEMDQFMGFLGTQDEILEGDGKITGLRIMNAPRDSLELKRDEVQAADQLQLDFLGYKVTPGNGTKHPVWGEIYYILTSKTGIKFGLVRPHHKPNEYFQIVDLRNGNFVRIQGNSYIKEGTGGKLFQASASEVTSTSMELRQINKTLDKLGYQMGRDFELKQDDGSDRIIIKLNGTKDFHSSVYRIEKILGKIYDINTNPAKAEIYLDSRGENIKIYH